MEKKKRSYKISSVVYLVCTPIWILCAYLNKGEVLMYLYIVLAIACISVALLQYTMSKRL